MKRNDQFAISFDTPVDMYTTLVLHFQYKLVHKDTGYHLTSYTARDGSQILLGATHMQVRIPPAFLASSTCGLLDVVALNVCYPYVYLSDTRLYVQPAGRSVKHYEKA